MPYDRIGPKGLLVVLLLMFLFWILPGATMHHDYEDYAPDNQSYISYQDDPEYQAMLDHECDRSINH